MFTIEFKFIAFNLRLKLNLFGIKISSNFYKIFKPELIFEYFVTLNYEFLTF